MKTLLVTVVVAAATLAQAADKPKAVTGIKEGNLDVNIATLSRMKGTVRDGSGKISQNTEVTPSGTIITRDSRGRVVVTSSENKDTGTTTHRDGSGRILGNTQKMASGNEVTRNAKGLITTTASTTTTENASNTTYRDSSGQIIGTKYVTPAGNIVYRNSNGEITGPNFK